MSYMKGKVIARVAFTLTKHRALYMLISHLVFSILINNMQIRHCHYWTWESLGKQTSDAVAQSTQQINLLNCQICKHVN